MNLQTLKLQKSSETFISYMPLLIFAFFVQSDFYKYELHFHNLISILQSYSSPIASEKLQG
jgi:hypothetical protein